MSWDMEQISYRHLQGSANLGSGEILGNLVDGTRRYSPYPNVQESGVSRECLVMWMRFLRHVSPYTLLPLHTLLSEIPSQDGQA